MQQINECFCDYNKNLLNNDFVFETADWEIVGFNNTLGNVFDKSTLHYFESNQSLRLKYYGNTVPSGLILKPSIDTPILLKNIGTYVFSFKTILKIVNPIPELTGRIRLINTNTPSDIKVFEFKIGNNTNPVYSYIFDKWQTFYKSFTVNTLNSTYNLELEIDDYNNNLIVYNEMFFGGFKIEYTSDRNQNIPSYYTKPQI